MHRRRHIHSECSHELKYNPNSKGHRNILPLHVWTNIQRGRQCILCRQHENALISRARSTSARLCDINKSAYEPMHTTTAPVLALEQATIEREKQSAKKKTKRNYREFTVWNFSFSFSISPARKNGTKPSTLTIYHAPLRPVVRFGYFSRVYYYFYFLLSRVPAVDRIA